MSKLLGGMGNMLKQAQQFQVKMKKVQEELSQKEVEAGSGGGMVKVRVNGKQEVLSITIEPEVMQDREMLQDLIAAAVNEALRESQKMLQDEMGKLTGGFNVPGLF